MGWALGGMLGGGALLGGIGSLLGMGAAKRRRKAMNQIANMPGIDPRAITDESLGAMGEAFPEASALGQRLDTYNQGQVEAALNASIPGYQEMQRTRTENAIDFLHGEIPKDVQDAVTRSSAAHAAGGGYAGTGAHRNLVSRDFGLTSLDLMKRGQEFSSGILASTPRATPTDISQLLGMNPAQLARAREDERSRKMQALLGATQQPTGAEIAGNQISNLGGISMGAGMSMLGSRMGGGYARMGPNMASSSAQNWYTG